MTAHINRKTHTHRTARSSPSSPSFRPTENGFISLKTARERRHNDAAIWPSPTPITAKRTGTEISRVYTEAGYINKREAGYINKSIKADKSRLTERGGFVDDSGAQLDMGNQELLGTSVPRYCASA